MPYFITDDAEGCSGWATIKEDGEVIGCHMTKQDAIDQMVAVSIAEDIQVGGERKKKKKPMQYRALPENYRSALEDDVPEGRACGNCLFFNEAKQITEDGLRKAYCERWMDYAQGGFYCNAWQPKKGELRAPAPAADQIKGSDENKPDSAKGAGGDIDFDEKTETALKNKVSDHNDRMSEQNKPSWTRTTLGQVKAVYRRGSGAYSTSHRPGVSRAAWSMARVNAYLYLLRNGRPENPAYTTDFDLLPEGHPKSTRKFIFLGLEHRQVDFSVPEYIQENAAQGLRWHREGLSGSGLVERTVREAAAMARGEITEKKVRRMAAWFARHMSDLTAPSAKPDHPNYPSPGVVAHALWGGGSRNQSERAMTWAEAKVKALDSEQRHASHDQLSHGRKGGPGKDIREDLDPVFFDSKGEPNQKTLDLIEKMNQSEIESGGAAGDNALKIIAEKQGFSGKPKTVKTVAELEAKQKKEGGTIVYRGLSDYSAQARAESNNDGGPISLSAEQSAANFRDGEYYGGLGFFGNGTYTSKSKEMASSYANTFDESEGKMGNGLVMAILIPANAIMPTESKVKSSLKALSWAQMEPNFDNNLGRSLAAQGFQAFDSGFVQSDKSGNIVILDRSMLTVAIEDVQGLK